MYMYTQLYADALLYINVCIFNDTSIRNHKHAYTGRYVCKNVNIF